MKREKSFRIFISQLPVIWDMAGIPKVKKLDQSTLEVLCQRLVEAVNRVQEKEKGERLQMKKSFFRLDA